MFTETIPYFHDKTKCLGFVAYDNQVKAKRPAILVAHAWRGQDDFARQKAIALAELGYVGFAVDLYGNGLSVTDAEAPNLMRPLFKDRALLQNRIGAAYDSLKVLSVVDRTQIGAIGFCFGGLTVYELLRSGVDLKGAVAFHGVFSTKETVPISPSAKGSMLILHGSDDPMTSAQELKTVQDELTQAKIDWQLHLFGGTAHAFTNHAANNPSTGAFYNEQSARRAWVMMQNFFSEIFLQA